MASRRSSKKVEKINILSDLVGACRVCMRKSDKMKDLFLPDSTFVEDIQLCTGILLTKTTSLPSIICEQCISHLKICLNFRNTCINSENSFRTLLENIKVEIDIKTEDVGLDNSLFVKEEIDLYNDNNDFNTNIEDDDIKDVLDLVIKKLPKETKVSKTRPAKAKTKQVKYRSLICMACELVFKTKKETLEHYSQIHNMMREKLVCEVCGKQFVYASSHYAHLRTHQSPGYSCAHCDYNTSHKTDLGKHMLVHTGEKKFQCHVCPKTFRTTSNLSGHIQRNHGGAKNYACHRCDKAFYTLTKLRRHLDSHDNIKRYECEFCQSSFTRRCYWKLHLQKKHSVITPRIRPGRRKNDLLIANAPSVFNK